jgi:hypothetical protein
VYIYDWSRWKYLPDVVFGVGVVVDIIGILLAFIVTEKEQTV